MVERNVWDQLISDCQIAFNLLGRSNYGLFLSSLKGLFSEIEDITPEEVEHILEMFPEPQPPSLRREDKSEEEEDFAEGLLEFPPDTIPLAQYQNHGWVDDFGADEFRNDPLYLRVRQKSGISDPEVLNDITENTLHILGRCNDPRDWGDNRQGLVYGMVQSGKTASMVNLIGMSIKAGYRLFILLAGDKSSLRNQTQERINDAFELTNGFNSDTKIHSPTYLKDYNQTGRDYMGSFQLQKMRLGHDIVNIIVVKKETNHLRDLATHLRQAKRWLNQQIEDPESRVENLNNLRAMIIDDEADSGSQDTRPMTDGSTIHNRIVTLRNIIDENCYAAYTATPQACLSAHPDDPIGYPKDFFWLLEPFTDECENGTRINRTYLGAYDIFWNEEHLLIEEIPKHQWPTYQKSPDGRTDGVFIPNKDGVEGAIISETRQDAAQLEFLQEITSRERDVPDSLKDALADFLIGCGLKWWSHWKKNSPPNSPLPGKEEIAKSYPHHAIMVHLSRLSEHQKESRKVTQLAWEQLKAEFESIEFSTYDENLDNRIIRRWNNQITRLQEYQHPTGRLNLRLPDLKHFLIIAIEIVERPIHDDTQTHYPVLRGSPFIYLINSDEREGMRLYYDKKTYDEKLLTKTASIIVGGQILSRGLTIRGLSVSFFGRSAKMPMGDSVLQMGRWFGHKREDLDLIKIYMPEKLKVLFRDIAIADLELRRQIKDAILKNLRPTQILLELRNSPQFKSTSSSKSRFVNSQSGSSFSGKRALLREPTFTARAIEKNAKILHRFQENKTGLPVHQRGTLYRNVNVSEVIELLEKFSCKDDAIQSSFKDYARYLKEWLDGEGLPNLPEINIAVMNGIKTRKRRFSTTRPSSSEEARRTAQGMYDAIIGGSATNYLGDEFIDRDEAWHINNPNAKKTRARGDPILIIFYRLHPNYVTRKLWNGTEFVNVPKVYLQNGDPFFIDPSKMEPENFHTILFVANTPLGGPQYGIGYNAALDPNEIVQIGMDSLIDDEEIDSDD